LSSIIKISCLRKKTARVKKKIWQVKKCYLSKKDIYMFVKRKVLTLSPLPPHIVAGMSLFLGGRGG
jgi:hypothetical protein